MEPLIGHVVVAILECQVQRLRQRIDICSAVVPHGFEIKRFKQIQRFKQRPSLTVRRAHINVNAMEVSAVSFNLFSVEICQILILNEAAEGFREVGNFMGKLSAVHKVLGFLIAHGTDFAQKFCIVRVPDDVIVLCKSPVAAVNFFGFVVHKSVKVLAKACLNL